MKNFIAKKKSPLPLPLALLSAALLSLQACDETSQPLISPEAPSATLELTPYSVARTLSGVPFTIDQVREVWDGVNASSANGYDEEYTFSDMFSSPGRGVGDELSGTRSSGVYPEPFSKLIASRLGESVASSDLRIYWPYSEDWDGVSMPAITFCPEVALESHVAYQREELPGGKWIVKEIPVDEDPEDTDEADGDVEYI